MADFQCVWPYDRAAGGMVIVCHGTPEVRGLCHRHYMQARRLGNLAEFPSAEFFGDIDTRRVPDRGRATICNCEVPRRGDADQCERCGRLIADAARVAYLRELYVRKGDRWVRR